MENLVIALNVQDGVQKKPLLLNYLDDETSDVYKNSSTVRPAKTYDAVIALLDRHFLPQNNITYEHYVFQMFHKMWMRTFISFTYVPKNEW